MTKPKPTDEPSPAGESAKEGESKAPARRARPRGAKVPLEPDGPLPRVTPEGAEGVAAPGGAPKPSSAGAPATSPGPLAPRTKESFDELARRVAKAEPRRGSITQPPPAWEPDEVTLGFAMVNEPSGEAHELPEPELLATVLIAVETDRRGILNRVAANFEEEIDAVANLFWPFLILHSGAGDQVAIFDGTGVWKRTFRYTLMPSMDGVQPLMDDAATPAEYLPRMQKLAPHFGRDAGAEILTVEGFLPVDPPLLFDVLTQSRFRTDPQAPHAGFLPARHKMEWYDEEVARMRAWLDRFERDLVTLTETRGKVEALVKQLQARLEEDHRKKEEEGRKVAVEASEQADREIAELARSHHAEVQEHLETIRRSQGVVAQSEAVASTSETLAFRASNRRSDPSPHQARSRQAQGAARTANRQIGESRRAIEKIHERQREAQEAALAKVAQVERANARVLAEQELFRDEFAAAATDLLQSIDGQIAARSTQRNVLSGYFLPFPSLANVSVVWLPLWMATLRGPRGVRQIVFPPMQVRAAVGLGGALKRLFGGIVLPLEPRTAQFDKVLRPTMEDALARDPWLSSATQELTRAADVLVDPDVLVRLQEGLGQLRRQGWVTRKQEEEFLKVYADRSRRRAAAGAPAPSAVPLGAKVDTGPDAERPEGPGPGESPR